MVIADEMTLLRTFQYSIGDARFARNIAGFLIRFYFQYSIGDAGVRVPLDMEQVRQPFNTPLEMPRYHATATTLGQSSSLSILHWRCKYCNGQIILSKRGESFNTPLEMPKISAISSIADLRLWPFNTPLEMQKRRYT